MAGSRTRPLRGDPRAAAAEFRADAPHLSADAAGLALPALLAAEGGGWIGLSPWLLVIGVLLLGGCLACLWLQLQRQVELAELARRQATGHDELRQLVARWVTEREALDLRRIEHVLVDVRDGQARVEDALLRTVELASRSHDERAPSLPTQSTSPTEGGAAAGATLDPEAIVERITNRLLALGYDRVQVVTARDELQTLSASGRAEVLVEARRGGVAHKGRVLLSAGRIADIDIRPPYAMFP